MSKGLKSAWEIALEKTEPLSDTEKGKGLV